jgi:hypothetical protein
MATLTLTLNDTIAARVMDALAERHGYSGFEPDGVTPQTKAQFTRGLLYTWMRNEVLEHEQSKAAIAARNAVTPVPL